MIDSGNDAGRYHPPPNIPPPDIGSIYSCATVQGSPYRDFSASRWEDRTRFHQRVLLKQRIETARKEREPAASTQTAESMRPVTGAREAASPEARAFQSPVQVQDPIANAPAIPQATQVGITGEIAQATHAPEEAVQGSRRTPEDGKPEVAEPRAGAGKPDTGHDAEAAYASAQAEGLRSGKAGLGSRWFALRSVFPGGAETRAGVRAPKPPMPVLAIFSQAGGVGKTSLAATLGRVLASRGEQVFLAETGSPGLLPFFFGSREGEPGVVRSFSPPPGSADAAVQALTLDPRQLLEKRDAADPLTEALLRYARASHRLLIDIQTGSKMVAHRLLPLVSMVLVPLLPDMNSVMSVNTVEAVFANREGTGKGEPHGLQIEPVYLLNQFDEILPLHLKVRELLQEQLGGRLLPFVVHRSAAVSEALAEGMTIVDYAPGSAVTEDYVHLANWLASAVPIAAFGLGELRWSER